MRATIKDISRYAGVSTATVDRVLNARPGVKQRTCDQVLSAAVALGYIRQENTPAVPPPVTLQILLPSGTNAFIAALGKQIELEASEFTGVSVNIDYTEVLDPEVIATRLDAIGSNCDGVAMIAVDHPVVRESMKKLADRKIPVVTLLSDIPDVSRIEYVGIDNMQAGRLAGLVLGKFLSSKSQKVALFTGSLAFRGHQEREMGFRQILSQEMPHLTIAGLIESHDDRNVAHQKTCELLDNHRDLQGIYNAGGATLGIAKALKERGKSSQIHLIAHEVTVANRTLLLDGTIDACIDQNPVLAARETVAALVNAARSTAHRPYPIRLHMVFRENLPEA